MLSNQLGLVNRAAFREISQLLTLASNLMTSNLYSFPPMLNIVRSPLTLRAQSLCFRQTLDPNYNTRTLNQALDFRCINRVLSLFKQNKHVKCHAPLYISFREVSTFGTVLWVEYGNYICFINHITGTYNPIKILSS